MDSTLETFAHILQHLSLQDLESISQINHVYAQLCRSDNHD